MTKAVKRSNRKLTLLVLFSGLLVGLAFVIPLLRQFFVSTEMSNSDPLPVPRVSSKSPMWDQYMELGEVWFNPPKDILGNDSSPPPPTDHELNNACTLVKAICFSPKEVAQIKELGYFQGLEILVLGNVTDQDLEHLPDLPNLRMVCINSDNFNGKGLKFLAEQSSLEELNLLFVSNLSGSEIKDLPDFDSVTNLYLRQCPIDDPLLEGVGDHFRNLETFTISFQRFDGSLVDCDSLDPILKLSKLQRLYLTGINVEPSQYQKLRQLEQLESVAMRWLVPAGKAKLQKLFPNGDFRY